MTQTKAKPKRFTRNYDPMPKPKRGIAQFYMNLVAWGVFVTIENGDLVIKTPTNNVSPALRKSIEERKDKLMTHIKSLSKQGTK